MSLSVVGVVEAAGLPYYCCVLSDNESKPAAAAAAAQNKTFLAD